MRTETRRGSPKRRKAGERWPPSWLGSKEGALPRAPRPALGESGSGGTEPSWLASQEGADKERLGADPDAKPVAQILCEFRQAPLGARRGPLDRLALERFQKKILWPRERVSTNDIVPARQREVLFLGLGNGEGFVLCGVAKLRVVVRSQDVQRTLEAVKEALAEGPR